jgi:hypothetical protein
MAWIDPDDYWSSDNQELLDIQRRFNEMNNLMFEAMRLSGPEEPKGTWWYLLATTAEPDALDAEIVLEDILDAEYTTE